MRVVLAGGGSAGHIEPALALADALRQADSSIQVTCLGTQRGLETRLVPLRGYELELIPAVPLPRSVTPQLLTVPGRLAGAVHSVGSILDRLGADVLVGFGGYVATPAYLAAKRHKVPIVVHEANPLPGIANRLGAHLTTHVFTGHPDTKLRNGRYLGLPIRRQIAELDRFALGDKARAHFGLRPDLPVLLVTGGSQGAVSLNRALAGAVSAITSAGVQVLHVTGPKHLNEIQAPSGPVPYVAVPYVDRMDLAYAAADFALCRGGAMTCAELTAVGLPAAYVPLPHGNGEQRLNALPIVQRGGGLLIDDAELTADWIRTSLLPVLTNIDQVAGMSEAAAAMGGRTPTASWRRRSSTSSPPRRPAERPSTAGPRPGRPGPGRRGQPAPRPAPRPRRRRRAVGVPGVAAARPGPPQPGAGQPVHPADHPPPAGAGRRSQQRPRPAQQAPGGHQRQRSPRRAVRARPVPGRPAAAGPALGPSGAAWPVPGGPAAPPRRPRRSSRPRPRSRRRHRRHRSPPQSPPVRPRLSRTESGPGRHRQARS